MSEDRSKTNERWRELAELLGIGGGSAPAPTAPEPAAPAEEADENPPVPSDAITPGAAIHLDEIAHVDDVPAEDGGDRRRRRSRRGRRRDREESEAAPEATEAVDVTLPPASPDDDIEDAVVEGDLPPVDAPTEEGGPEEAGEAGEPGEEGDRPRRRRRRRRRGKGGRREEGEGDAKPVAGPESSDADPEDGAEPGPVDEDDEDADDEVPLRPDRPTAEDDDDGDESDFDREIWADWNVPSWQELIDGLHRPEHR